MTRFSPLLLAVALGACATTGAVGRDVAGLEPGSGRFLTGEVVGLAPRAVADARDFTYAVDLTRAPAALAYSHLGAKEFSLGLWDLDPAPAKVGEAAVTLAQFDVEAVAFSPDGARIAAAARDGRVRVFTRAPFALAKTLVTDEPLSALAWSPDGRYLIAGSQTGLVTVFHGPELRFGTEARLHQDEVRAIAFASDGRMFSGGWDKAIQVSRISDEARAVHQARVRFQREKGLTVFMASVNDRSAMPFTFSADATYAVLTAKAAKAVGIDPEALTESVTLPGPSGEVNARLAQGQLIAVEGLRIPDAEIAVCDACVPAGLDGVLGQRLAARYDFAFDETMGELTVSAKERSEDAAKELLPKLEPLLRHAFQLHVNDLTSDAAGKRLGVAFGVGKAERTYEVYQAEKKGIEPDLAEGNAGAVVDAQSGAIVRRHVKHRGVVATAAISPDGRTLVTGGWDKRLFVFAEGEDEPVAEQKFGWSVRRARFSPDARYLGVAAWTPQTATPNQDSDPAAVAYDVLYKSPEVAK